MARYNLLRGLKPPASGHWRNNPEADDIDFQIEADFIGRSLTTVVGRQQTVEPVPERVERPQGFTNEPLLEFRRPDARATLRAAVRFTTPSAASRLTKRRESRFPCGRSAIT